MGAREHMGMGASLWEHGNMGAREHGGMGTWEHGNRAQKHGFMGKREHGGTGTWGHGNMGARENACPHDNEKSGGCDIEATAPA